MLSTLWRACRGGLIALAAAGLYSGWAIAAPDQLRIAILPTTGPENGWDAVVFEAVNRVAKEAPHGVKVSVDLKGPVYGDKAEVFLRILAKSGEFDVIISSAPHSDQIEKVMKDYPDILFASFGSGNHTSGANHYHYYGRVHQPAYLLGLLAGGMTKSNLLGVVGSFPSPEINDQLNAYIAGAKSINPNAKLKVTFIETWFDPPKASEAAYAQIATGVDVLVNLASDSFEPCQKKKIWCLSKYRDTTKLAPDVVLSGTLLFWDPAVRDVINIWYDHKTNNTPYKADTNPKWFSMKEGGSDLVPYYDLASKIPDELKAKIEQAKADIISGKLEVPLNEAPVTSD